jgi:hypothetical protein
MSKQLAYANRSRVGMVTRSQTFANTGTRNGIAATATLTDTITSLSESTTMSPLEDASLLQHIVSYVGINQYRYVASISKEFQRGYLHLFPDNKST